MKFYNTEIKIEEDNKIIIEIEEGRAQLKNYWIAKIEKSGSFYEIKEFLKCKQFNKTKIFKIEEEGDYIIQLGKKTQNDKSQRLSLIKSNDSLIIEK